MNEGSEKHETSQLIHIFSEIKDLCDKAILSLGTTGREMKKMTPATPNLPYQEIIDYLNKVCGTSYRATSKDTQKHINARYKETPDITLEDFKAVIDTKQAQWGNDPKMSEYLRPKTLFGSNFENYLQQAQKKTVDPLAKLFDG